MYNEALHDRYLQCLQDAMARDEAASLAQQKGNYRAAAEGYEAAAALYAQAASNLLDAGYDCSSAEQSDFEKSVDRLIAISKDLKQHAAKLRAAKPSAEEKKSGAVAASGDDEDCAFVPAETPEVTFRDIAGLAEAKQLIMDEIINPVLYRELYQRFHIECNGGLLLFGPPGSGKTMVARAVAAQAKMAFFSVRCSDIVGKYFGEAERNVKSLFETARAEQSAIIFFDEFEALAAKRGGNSTVMNRLVPELLSQMDGFTADDSQGRLLILAATNRPWDIDSAFMRPPRLTQKIHVSLPDYPARLFLIEKAFRNVPVDGFDAGTCADRTEGSNAADIVALCNQIKMAAVQRTISVNGETSPVTAEDMEKALARYHPSVQKSDIVQIRRWEESQGA